MADTPAHIARFVNVIGAELALQLFLAVGGSQINLPRRSSGSTPAAQAIGADQVERLAEAFGPGYIKVPLARRWIAGQLRAKGTSDNEIARIVRADVETVRRWDTSVAAKSTAQLDLF